MDSESRLPSRLVSLGSLDASKQAIVARRATRRILTEFGFLSARRVANHSTDSVAFVSASQVVQGFKEGLSYVTKKRHLQGFGTAPVQDLLEPVKNKLSGVAEQAGVDIIISKWQIDYQSKDDEMIDVTEALARLYVSEKDAAGIIAGMENIKPISEEEGVKIND